MRNQSCKGMKTISLLAFLLNTCLICAGQGNELKELYIEAQNHYKAGQKEKALEVYEKIYQTDYKQASALEWMTFIYADMDQPEKAARSGAKLCLLKPDKASFQNNTCYYFAISGQPEIAEAYGKKAVELDGYQYNYLLNLGHTYLIRQQTKEATYWYIKALQWVTSKTDFEESFIGDLNYLAEYNLVSKPTAKKFIDGLSGEFEGMMKNQENNYLVDSILTCRKRKTNRKEKEKMINWMKEFSLTETKKEVVRFNVLANFLTEIGMDEFNKRNRSMAMDLYWKYAEEMYKNDADSLGQAGFLLQVSRELLTILQVENKFSKNSAALSYASDAINIIKKYNIRELEVPALVQLSACYFHNKEFENGENALRQLLKRSIEKKDSAGIAFAYNGLSNYFKKSLYIDSAVFYNQMGLKYKGSHQIPTALKYSLDYRQVELLYESGETKKSIESAIRLQTELQQSLSTLKEQSDLYELIGKISYESLAYDYSKLFLDSAIQTYLEYTDQYSSGPAINTIGPPTLSVARKLSLNILSFLAAKKGDMKELFFYTEVKKDNFLRENLSSTLADPPYVVNFESTQKKLQENTACISYSGTSGSLSLGMAFNAASHAIKLLGEEYLLSVFRNTPLPGITKELSEVFAKLGHTKVDTLLTLVSLSNMQYYYLSNRDPANIRGIAVKQKENAGSKELSEEVKSLSRLLYNMYVQPFESIIKNKKNLVISPDFVLQIFPFEALILPDGRFMGEVYNITYTPGFTISEYLDRRSYTSDKSLIAFGNPDYSAYHPEKLSGRALDFSYLGITSWNDLPGTEKELSAVNSLAKGIEFKTGENLSESIIKEMSDKGTLKRGSILHFALHGIAGPARAKEDNSLVVTEPDGGHEDGLLQFSEVLNLQIKAEFVCLSACESGINQIEDDGSMVTMSTAFLAAGAKAVLATNWSIDDAATALFIKDVYRQHKEKNIPFAEAVANTRRSFIKGDFGEKYKKPYYWAPFKYFGN